MKIMDRTIKELTHDKESKNFSHHGCENCFNSLGNDVYECNAYPESFFKKDADPEDYYEIELCHECVYAFHHESEVEKHENCIDDFKIFFRK